MQAHSYVISAAGGAGVYRHIQIASDATLKDLHLAIAAAYGLKGVKGPAFIPQSSQASYPASRHSTRDSEKGAAMGQVALHQTPLAGSGRMAYSLSDPKVLLNIKRLSSIPDLTPSPKVLRQSGQLDYLAELAVRALRSMLRTDQVPERLQEHVEMLDASPQARERVVSYILAASNLYGLVSLSWLHHLYCRYQPAVPALLFMLLGLALSSKPNARVKLLDDDGKRVTQRNLDEVVECHVMENSSGSDQATFEYLRHMQGNKPYFVPMEEELLPWQDEDYAEMTPSHRRMESFLVQSGLTRQEASHCLLDMLDIIRFRDSDEQELMTLLEDVGLRLRGQFQAQRFMDLFIDLSNNTRMQVNRGHTPQELVRLMHPDRLQEAAPQENLSGGTLAPIIKFPIAHQADNPAVGRNSPCPCGSGKKYKHCCMKK